MLLWVMCNMKSNLFSLNLFCSPKKRKTIVSDLTQSSFGPSLQWIPWQEIFSSNLWRNWKEITNSSSQPLLCTWMDFKTYRNSFKGHHLATLSVFKIIASDTVKSHGSTHYSLTSPVKGTRSNLIFAFHKRPELGGRRRNREVVIRSRRQIGMHREKWFEFITWF